MTTQEHGPHHAQPPALAPVQLPVAPPYTAPYRPYPYPHDPYAPPSSTNGMAIASMVLGIVWVYGVGSILALIFGYVARHEIKRNGQGGDGMAIAGIVLGWVGLAGLGLVVLSYIAAAGSGPLLYQP